MSSPIIRVMICLSLSGTVPTYSCWPTVIIDSALFQSQNFPSLDTKVYGHLPIINMVKIFHLFPLQTLKIY